LLLILKSQYMQRSLQYLGKYAFIQRETRRFWKDLRQTNPFHAPILIHREAALLELP
ncbi:hypothetical protein T02_5392, partial [Trichinella nativa]